MNLKQIALATITTIISQNILTSQNQNLDFVKTMTSNQRFADGVYVATTASACNTLWTTGEGVTPVITLLGASALTHKYSQEISNAGYNPNTIRSTIAFGVGLYHIANLVSLRRQMLKNRNEKKQ